MLSAFMAPSSSQMVGEVPCESRRDLRSNLAPSSDQSTSNLGLGGNGITDGLVLVLQEVGPAQINQFWRGVQGMGQFFLQLGAGRDFAIKPEVGEPRCFQKFAQGKPGWLGFQGLICPTQLQELQLAPIFLPMN